MYTGLDDKPIDDETSTPDAVWGSGLVVDQEFVEAHRAFVRRSLLRLGMSASDVEDGVQEVLLAAVAGAERFEAGRSQRGWLYGIAVNVARSQRRRRVRFGFISAEPPEIGVPPEQERRLEGKAARSLIHRALDELPEEQRDVVVLHRLEGWPINVVAEAVGCPVATAHSRLRLGTARLGRVVRGNVVRGRWAALVAALASALGWPPAAAAATTAAMLVVGTWATVATLSDAETPEESTSSASRPASATLARATPRPEPVLLPEPEAVLPQPEAVPNEPPSSSGLEASSRGAGPSLDRQARGASEATPSAGAELARSADVAGERSATPAPSGAGGSAQQATSSAPEDPPLTGGTVLEETQLLGRARTVAASSPEVARELLQRYDARFPNGQLRRERNAIAALLGQ